MKTDEQITAEMEAIVDRIRPILSGQEPSLIGCVLADLTATWIAGHFVDSSDEGTREWRVVLLRLLVEAVQAMLALEDE